MDKIGDLIPTDDLLRRRYYVIRRLDQGTYGQVFLGRKVCGTQHMVAVKAERRFGKFTDFDPRRLVIEQKVLILLRGKPHIPVIYASGKSKKKRPYIVMSLLGSSLWDLQREQADNCLSLHTTIRASQQVLCGLQYLHEVGYVHRDLKPNNTCVGKKDPQTVYIIDFGMCRRFVLPNGKKRPPRKRPEIRCTYRYASIRMHERVECGPSDDIQCWLYAIVELHKDKLPWKLLDDCEEIFKMKKRN
ncbi:hypothetical protein M3Y94_01040600 [Aphelenchoides besseyi]|nr:hypothetical protein M3Y94_01040600 [Aphelenchoides besseyi]